MVLPKANLAHTASIIKGTSPLKILAIGSSSTQGIGATAPKFAYPAQLMTELGALKSFGNVEVRNAGIGGETIEQTLKRLVQELDSYKPDLVLWQVGTNDAITGDSDPELFRKLIGEGIKSILDRQIDAILIDPQFYLKIPNAAVYEHYVEMVHAAAQDNKIAVFPRYKLMQAWNKQPGGVTRMMGPDGFHMGNRGYACLADLLTTEITTAVDRNKVVESSITKVASP